MKVYRTSEVLVGGRYEIGDIVRYTLETGEEIEAIAVKEEYIGNYEPCMTFMLLDCLNDTCRMNLEDTNEGGYEESYLREWLNKECIEKFPFAMRMNMIPFDNGDLLRIPTEREIFGRNIYGEEEPDTVRQFEPMKKRRNRLASAGLNGEYQYYWLKNKRVRSATYFCFVDSYGNASNSNAFYSYGVRPLYRLRNYR